MAEETTYFKLKKPLGNENADIADINDNMDNIDSALKNISDNIEEAKEAAGNTDVITATNISVQVSAWTTDTTYDDFPFRAAIAITGCTTEYKPDVTFGLDDSMSGNFAPIAETYAGGVYIYAAETPEAAVTIPTITLLRKKEAS